MIEMILSDDVATVTLQALNVPLTEATINNDVKVITLDNNLSVYIVPGSDKRVWSHTWAYMDEDEFNILKGFRDRQRTLFKFPEVTITEQGINNVPVWMELNPKNIIDHCGTVQGVSIELRETIQMPDEGSS